MPGYTSFGPLASSGPGWQQSRLTATNNAIFDDIFWVHLAYVAVEDGIERLRGLLRADHHYLIWSGNLKLLEHEQRALVQPNFDRLSCAFSRLMSMGSATSFGVRGVRQEVAYFTAFYLYSLTHGAQPALRQRTWPRITRFDDRWDWIVTSVVPRFRRFEADTRLIDASMRRILAESRGYASIPCEPQR